MTDLVRESQSVVISHSRADRDTARRFADLLGDRGIRVRLSSRHTSPGTNFVRSINVALTHADVVLVLLSSSFRGSGLESHDWGAATLGRQRKVIPVRIDDTDINELIGPIAYIDAVGRIDAQLVDDLLKVLTGRESPSTAVPFPTRSPGRAARQYAEAKVWHVPMARNLSFIGRERLLDVLQQEFAQDQASLRTRAISGAAGAGKTQLALEYVYRHQNEYDVVWWIRASEPVQMREDLGELGRTLGVVHNPQDWVNAAQRVRDWCETTDRRWLFIYDDLQDPTSVPELPESGSGRVIITSRNKHWPADLPPLEVDSLPTHAAVEFLLRRTGSRDETGAYRLARMLGGWALALEQAAAYVAETGVSFDAYQERLNLTLSSSWDRSQGLEDQQILRATQWLNQKEASEQDASAIQLLTWLSFLGTGSIPLRLLGPSYEEVHDAWTGSVDRPSTPVEDGLRTLARLGLVRAGSGPEVLVHPLTRRFVRETTSSSEGARVLRSCISWLDASLPDDCETPRSWSLYSAIFPHALAVLAESRDHGFVDHSKLSSIMLRLGAYSELRGDSALACRLLEGALSNDEWSGLAKRRGSTRSVSNLALALAESGQVSKALDLVEDLSRERQVDPNGVNDQEVLTLAINMGAMLAESGRLSDAANLYRRVLDDIMSSSGSHSQNRAVLTALSNLATIFEQVGNTEQAYSVYERILSQRARLLGFQHPDTIHSLNRLSRVSQQLGRSEQAGELAEKAFFLAERVMGPGHPTTQEALDNLAANCRAVGDLDAARSYLNLCLTIRLKQFGPNHPDTLTTESNLAVLLAELGDLDGARIKAEGVLYSRRKVLGQDHPDTVSSYHTLRTIAAQIDDWSRVEQLDREFDRAPAAASGNVSMDFELEPYADAIASETGDVDSKAVRSSEAADGASTMHSREVGA